MKVNPWKNILKKIRERTLERKSTKESKISENTLEKKSAKQFFKKIRKLLLRTNPQNNVWIKRNPITDSQEQICWTKFCEITPLKEITSNNQKFSLRVIFIFCYFDRNSANIWKKIRKAIFKRNYLEKKSANQSAKIKIHNLREQVYKTKSVKLYLKEN